MSRLPRYSTAGSLSTTTLSNWPSLLLLTHSSKCNHFLFSVVIEFKYWVFIIACTCIVRCWEVSQHHPAVDHFFPGRPYFQQLNSLPLNLADGEPHLDQSSLHYSRALDSLCLWTDRADLAKSVPKEYALQNHSLPPTKPLCLA